MVLGDLIPGQPWWYLPHTGGVYFRESQLPEGEEFRTKLELGVEMLRQASADSEALLLGLFAGAYATRKVIRGCLEPEGDVRRSAMLTPRPPTAGSSAALRPPAIAE